MSDLIRVDAPDTLHGWALVVPGSPEHIRYTTSAPAAESAPAGGDLDLDPDATQDGDEAPGSQDQSPDGETVTETQASKPVGKPKPASKTAKGK